MAVDESKLNVFMQADIAPHAPKHAGPFSSPKSSPAFVPRMFNLIFEARP